MTSFSDAAASPPIAPYDIRYVGESGYTMPVRRASRARAIAVRTAIAVLFAITVALAGALIARSIAGQTVAAPVGLNPVPGEFRLGPGNQVPPGVVVPLHGAGVDAPVPGEYRLAPGNQVPPGVQIPLDQDRGLSDPVEWRPSLVPVR